MYAHPSLLLLLHAQVTCAQRCCLRHARGLHRATEQASEHSEFLLHPEAEARRAPVHGWNRSHLLQAVGSIPGRRRRATVALGKLHL